MTNDLTIPLTETDTFRFACSDKVACFNACCQDLNQFLTPYDILRLKNHLNLTSSEFLHDYTVMHIGPESGLPVVSLKTKDTLERTCPFVTPSGCHVYANRPSSCRIYPMARAITRNRASGELSEHFMLIREPHCQGHQEGPDWTPHLWMADQGLKRYNAMNDLLMEIIRLKNQIMPGPLDQVGASTFYQSAYDLDTFRDQIVTHGLWEAFAPDQTIIAPLVEDDDTLLQLGLKWIEHKLFGRSFSFESLTTTE